MAEIEGTGAREAEGSGLLSRPASDGRAGSNPAPSVSECLPDAERGVVPVVESNASVGASFGAGVRLSRESTPSCVAASGHGPTLHKALVARAVDPELTRIEGMLRNAADEHVRGFLIDWRYKLERVYAEGLRDGFVQGVEANNGR